jgi:hypothetical protein
MVFTLVNVCAYLMEKDQKMLTKDNLDVALQLYISQYMDAL